LTIKRLLTAAVALPILILLLVKGSFFLFTCVILLCSFLGLSEFYRMALPDRRIEGVAASLTGAFLPLAFLAHDSVKLLGAVTAIMLLSALLFLFSIRDIRQSSGEVALYLMGFLYVPLLLGHLILLRGLPFGVQWIFLLLTIVMAGDSAAYYIGSNFGRRKLYPVVSPNKSVEGSLGGIAGSLSGALAAKYLFFPQLTLADVVMTALLLGILGQLGDLFESLLKRSFGVKDSGRIIPGHGGILDRLDSILFAAPAAFYYALFVFAGK
jgi:phosphatidate cytidylyltransferase